MLVCQNNNTSHWCMIIAIPKNQINTENVYELNGIHANLEFQLDDQETNQEKTTLNCGCHFPLGTRLARYLKRRKSRKRK